MGPSAALLFPIGNMVVSTSTDIGSAVRTARRAQGLQQEDLALVAGTGRRFISDLERGKPTARLEPTLRVLHALGLEVVLTPSGDAGADPGA